MPKLCQQREEVGEADRAVRWPRLPQIRPGRRSRAVESSVIGRRKWHRRERIDARVANRTEACEHRQEISQRDGAISVGVEEVPEVERIAAATGELTAERRL